MKKCFDCYWKHSFPFQKGKNGVEYFCELPKSNRRKYKNHLVITAKTCACNYFKTNIRWTKEHDLSTGKTKKVKAYEGRHF